MALRSQYTVDKIIVYKTVSEVDILDNITKYLEEGYDCTRLRSLSDDAESDGFESFDYSSKFASCRGIIQFSTDDYVNTHLYEFYETEKFCNGKREIAGLFFKNETECQSRIDPIGDICRVSDGFEYIASDITVNDENCLMFCLTIKNYYESDSTYFWFQLAIALSKNCATDALVDDLEKLSTDLITMNDFCKNEQVVEMMTLFRDEKICSEFSFDTTPPFICSKNVPMTLFGAFNQAFNIQEFFLRILVTLIILGTLIKQVLSSSTSPAHSFNWKNIFILQELFDVRRNCVVAIKQRWKYCSWFLLYGATIGAAVWIWDHYSNHGNNQTVVAFTNDWQEFTGLGYSCKRFLPTEFAYYTWESSFDTSNCSSDSLGGGGGGG